MNWIVYNFVLLIRFYYITQWNQIHRDEIKKEMELSISHVLNLSNMYIFISLNMIFIN